jgi:hypothetical protein
MTTAVIYESNGKIVTIRSGNERSVRADAEASGKSYLITDEQASLDDHYVSVANTEIRTYPDKPAEGYVFNYSTEAWELNLTLAKDFKWADIKTARKSQEFGTFDWGGYAFQCDEVSQRRIQSAVQLAEIDSTMTLDWTLADNTVQTFTAAEYVQIGQALANHVSQCHERGRILRQQIQSATTEAELEAIVW